MLRSCSIIFIMSEKGILIKKLPKLKNPLLVAGFDGWGNAMNISSGIVEYLVRKMKARPFASLNPDTFYHYDESRPIVNIIEGNLISLSPPGGSFFAAKIDSARGDLVLLDADEPNLKWYQFADELISLCSQLNVETFVVLGSMYDKVLHTDKIVSGIASTTALTQQLKDHNVSAVSYQGPSAIHSTLLTRGQQAGLKCFSLWCHCPYYLQGATHYGLLSHMGSLLASFGEFEIDLSDLDSRWMELNEQIQLLIESNPALQSVINELRKAKVRGSWERMKESTKGNEKVINLKDFLKP